MRNPYSAKGSESFWKQAIATRPPNEVLPIPGKRFRIEPADSIATAGSCFAQNLAKFLKLRGGVHFLEVEPISPDQPSFSALYGNIYTARQLLQLVQEALGERAPTDFVWRRPDGAFVDALRPSVFAGGFTDEAAVIAARAPHIDAVRSLLRSCTVFVFTLGLTEAWRSGRDGTVFPVAPGIIAEPARPQDYEFHNFTYGEVCEDLRQVVTQIQRVNPAVRILLTVSPVPLTATYSEEHVLVATTHSKAILRAVAAATAADYGCVYYFPAYEIITGNFNRGRYFEDNLRTITPEGVSHVMRVFELAYGMSDSGGGPSREWPGKSSPLFADSGENMICDEEEIVKSLGF